MRKYLESYKFYVENKHDKLVYKVADYQVYDDCDYIQINLELVAGWDYVNPDENDVQGWCPAENFVEDIQFEYVLQYFFAEGMKEALEEHEYTILEKISPNLQKIIDKHNEA